MRSALRRATFVLSLLLLSGVDLTAGGDAAKSPYVEPVPFGPHDASHPWHAAFSPDGRWLGVVDGYRSALQVWDVASGERRLERKLGGYGHCCAFSRDGARLATLEKNHLLVVVLRDGEWSESQRLPLGVETSLGGLWSPYSLTFDGSEKSVLFVEDDVVHEVDLASGAVRRHEEHGTDVLQVVVLPDRSWAVSRKKEFVTRIVPPEGSARSVPGVLLAASSDGGRWLMASDRERFDMGFRDRDRLSRLALEVREGQGSKVVARLALEGRRAESESYGHPLLRSAVFSPDGTLLVTAESLEGFVVRDARTLAPLQTMDDFRSYAMTAAFSPDGERLLTGGRRAPDRASVLLWRRAAAPK